jgi:AcrR family transcriptional regulator
MEMSALTDPTRGRPRDPRRREAILHAAIALVAEVGYDRMTVEALAHRAGVSKPTIYRRWPQGKPAIVAEAIHAKRAAAGPPPDTGSLRGDLLA